MGETIRAIPKGIGTLREGGGSPGQYSRIFDGRRSGRHPTFVRTLRGRHEEVLIRQSFRQTPKRHNERARFNQRREEAGESVDSFVTALYGLAEHCEYAGLHDETIRDRIVVGLRDAKLAENLQLDPDLTLEKAVTKARKAEAVKEQQPLVRGSGSLARPDVPGKGTSGHYCQHSVDDAGMLA